MTRVFHDLWITDPVPGYCCQDDYISAARGDTARKHTGGCPNRCSERVEVPFAAWRRLVAAYPCALAAGHDGDHDLHPAYRLSAVDPQQVCAALDAAGFVRAGHRTGQYVRYRWPHATAPGDQSFMVPLDPSYADYDDELTGTLRVLERAVADGERARAVLDGLRP